MISAAGIRRCLVLACVVLAFSGCSRFGGEDDTSLEAICPVEVVPAPAGWPLPIPDSILAISYSVDGGTLVAEGRAADAETALVEIMDVTLDGYEVGEPDGGATDVFVNFSDEFGDVEGVAWLTDEDSDDCWEVSVEAVFTNPPVVEPVPVQDPLADERNEELAEAREGLTEDLGSGTVTTEQGTETLLITECGTEPAKVRARASTGDLAIDQDGDRMRVEWTPLGAEDALVDDEANVLAASEGSIAVVAAFDEMTLVADLVCR